MGEEEEWAAEDAVRQGFPIPQKIANKPTLMHGLELYYSAFYRLSTCRSSGMGIGSIHWTAIDRYATAQDFDDDHRQDLHYHMSAMDRVFLKHCNKKSDTKKTG